MSQTQFSETIPSNYESFQDSQVRTSSPLNHLDESHVSFGANLNTSSSASDGSPPSYSTTVSMMRTPVTMHIPQDQLVCYLLSLFLFKQKLMFIFVFQYDTWNHQIGRIQEHPSQQFNMTDYLKPAPSSPKDNQGN